MLHQECFTSTFLPSQPLSLSPSHNYFLAPLGSALLFLAIFSIQEEVIHVPLQIYRSVTF